MSEDKPAEISQFTSGTQPELQSHGVEIETVAAYLNLRIKYALGAER